MSDNLPHPSRLPELPDLPCVDAAQFDAPTLDRLTPHMPSSHAPRFLLLYGSLRERSFSRLATEEAGRLLTAMGGEVRMFNPTGLPLPDSAPESHPKVQELRELAQWSEGMVWCSPERHGAMTGIMKAQIDWIPLSLGAVRPTQGKTLAVMQDPAARSASTLIVAGNEGMSVGKTGESLALPPATLSFHLKELSHAGLVQG